MMNGMQIRNAQKRAVPMTVYDKAGADRARKVTDRHPEEVAAPHAPERFVGFERAGSGADDGMDQVLNNAHHAKRDDGERGAAIQKIR